MVKFYFDETSGLLLRMLRYVDFAARTQSNTNRLLGLP